MNLSITPEITNNARECFHKNNLILNPDVRKYFKRLIDDVESLW